MPVTTVSAKLLEPVLQLARHFRQHSGQDLHHQILECAALSEQEFTKPGARFPASRYPDVLETLARASENPLIALNLGEATHPRMLGSIGFLMSTADTLAQAYQALIDYLPLLFEGAVLEMEQTTEGTQLSLELNQNDQRAVEYFLACLVNWPRWLTGHQVPARYIRLALPEPANIQPYQQFFAAEVEFGAPRNQLLLASDYLSLGCIEANHEMHQLHREFADSLLSKTALQSALTAQTRNLIRQQLAEGGGCVRREQIADSVGLSLRTLQRKLGLLGTNFQDIYDQTRREVCLQLIQRGQMSFGEIAFQLGFSNQSAFQKAFKRWMEMAPSEYRQRISPEAIESLPLQAPQTRDTEWLSSDNREQILAQRLAGLSLFSRELLDWAAIAGQQFDLNQLALVTDNPLARLAIHFWPAEQAGLILTVSEDDDKTRYRFADKPMWLYFAQQLSQRDKTRLHRKYGEALLQQLPTEPNLEQLATVLSHLNPALGLDQSPGQSINNGHAPASHNRLSPAESDLAQQLLTLNTRASEIARQQQDYVSASQYASAACLMAQSQQPELTHQLLLQCADLQLLSGDIDRAEIILQQIPANQINAADAAACALITARIYQHRGQFQNALQHLLEQLPLLDHALPEQSTEQLELLLSQLSFISDRFSAQSLSGMAELKDPESQIRLQLLEQISLLARQQSQPLLAACAIGRMTELSLRDGRTPLTAFAFVSYAWVASWFCADFSLAQTFSAQGMQLANQFGGLIAHFDPDAASTTQREPQGESQSKAQAIQGDIQTDIATSAALLQSSQVQHWFAPLETVQKQLQRIDQLSGSQGQWLLQSECQLLKAQLALFSSTPLAQQQTELQQQHQQMCRQQQLHQAQRLQSSSLDLIGQLQGVLLLPEQVSYQHGWQAASTIIAALLLDQQQLWPELYLWEAQLENELAGYFCVSEALFCTALMRLIQAQQQGAMSRRRQRQVEQLESRLELWANHCPTNFNCQLLLLQAEQARLQGRSPAELFEQALTAAEQQHFSFHQALVYERYADYLAAQGQQRLAFFCRGEAISFYRQWGADGKAKQLAQLRSLLAK